MPADSKIKRLAPDRWTLLSGILLVFVFAPWNLSWLVWIALVPWFEALRRASNFKKALLQGLWLGFFMTIGAFFWVSSVLSQYAGLPQIVGLLGLLLFGLVGQPQFLLFAPFQRLMQKKLLSEVESPLLLCGLVFVMGLAYSGVDWLLPKLFVDTLGHAFYEWPRLRQVADLGGPALLTLPVYLVNYTVFDLLARLRTRAEPSTWPALRLSLPLVGMCAVLCASAVMYGAIRIAQLKPIMAAPERTLQVGVIQANIGDFDKVAAEQGVRGAARKVLDTFYEMSEEALRLEPKPQVLIWPETSYPSTFRTPGNSEEFARDQQLQSFVNHTGVPLLFGGYDHEGRQDFNALFYLNPKRSDTVLTSSVEAELQTYRKNILLLFGEYIPGAEQFNWIKTAFPMVGNFGRGKGPEVLTIDTREGPVKSSPVICYEVLFPDYVIGAIRKGSQLIVNVTNDSWFGEWGEPELHLALSTFRSIETRTPQIRTTNTGISALILPDGSITHRTALFEPVILNATIPIIRPVPTLMIKWGDWYPRAAFAFAVLCLAVFFVASRKRLQ